MVTVKLNNVHGNGFVPNLMTNVDIRTRNEGFTGQNDDTINITVRDCGYQIDGEVSDLSFEVNLTLFNTQHP